MEILEPLCARCARHQQTCCQDSDIYVTTQDVARISAHVGHSDFTEYRVASDPVYLNEHHDPLWMEKVFRPDGSRRVLKQQSNLDCIFLGKQGCVLPTEVRPLICRLYPSSFRSTRFEWSLQNAVPGNFWRRVSPYLTPLRKT